MNPIGIVSAGLQLGFASLAEKKKRGIYSDTTEQLLAQAQVTIEELHTDELEITDHPVESGTQISDHAFKLPAEVTLKLGWSNSPSASGNLVNPALGVAVAASPTLQAIGQVVSAAQMVQGALNGASPDQVSAVYQDLRDLQDSRTPVTIFTGKRKYSSMLIQSLAVQTDGTSENALMVTMTCRQVVLVSTRVVKLPKSTQADAKATAEPTNRGTVSAVSATRNGG